jgi:hypothetical protein
MNCNDLYRPFEFMNILTIFITPNASDILRVLDMRANLLLIIDHSPALRKGDSDEYRFGNNCTFHLCGHYLGDADYGVYSEESFRPPPLLKCAIGLIQRLGAESVRAHILDGRLMMEFPDPGKINKSTAAFIIGVFCIIVAIVGKVDNYVDLAPERAFALGGLGLCLLILSAIIRDRN